MEGEEPGEGEIESEGEGEATEEGEVEGEIEGEGEISGEGEEEGEVEGEGEGEGETPEEGEGEMQEEGEGEQEGLFDCPEDTYFGQAATDVDALPEFAPGILVSDGDLYPEDPLPWDNFLVTGTVNAAASVYVYVSGVHWWGVEGIGPDDSCPESAGVFTLEIAETPTAEPTWSVDVMPEKIPANFTVEYEGRSRRCIRTQYRNWLKP